MKKVLLGMSGGVDSSVSAILLKEKGYDVIGATMNLTDNLNCNEVKEICDKLKIKHITLDYQKEFKNCVINYFIDEYANFKTPNPCVMCNKKLKFGLLYNYINDNDIDYLATGHYAKIEYSDKYNRYVLKKANNILKDQSYFLYNIDKNMLSRILFPLSEFNNKDEIRNIATYNGLTYSSKSDSQDICFIPNGDYKEFLQLNNITSKVGNIIYNEKVVGKHTGLYKYTIGQRKGLGISNNEALYVIGFNKNNNDLIVGEEKKLYTKEFLVKDYNLLLVDEIKNDIKVNVKIRYKSNEFPATISMEENNIKVIFDSPQKGVTPGQSAVFYVDDIVLGGGIII